MAEQVNRRRARRVDAKLNLEVKLSHVDGRVENASLEAINISTSGVYFKSGHFIEPMTKLAMDLDVCVPASEGADEPDTAHVPCEGLVVRVTPEAESADCDEYEIAVFFTHIEPQGLTNLEEHITMLLAEQD